MRTVPCRWLAIGTIPFIYLLYETGSHCVPMAILELAM